MIKCAHILFLLAVLSLAIRADAQQKFSFDFYGDSIAFSYDAKAGIDPNEQHLAEAVPAFFETATAGDHASVLATLSNYKKLRQPDDWIYYQLIRRTAQTIAPKEDNYYRYTLYKCFLLAASGYDAALTVVGPKLLFFVSSKDDIYDIPAFSRDGKRYVCLNFHDYGYDIDLGGAEAKTISLPFPDAQQTFSYKLTRLPQFRPEDYHEKELRFSYHNPGYDFKVKLNNEIKKLFVNYPVTDYGLYLNSPLSTETYNTLIPHLKKYTRHMSVKGGLDYLMHFTRYAFAYEADTRHFGREKHLSPEQTLLYDSSDCEDRAALFYCLVKELYNIPMVILTFPEHVTVAVKLDKPVGRQIVYNGSSYSVCEPTPQYDDLPIGSLPPDLKAAEYQVAYSYNPE